MRRRGRNARADEKQTSESLALYIRMRGQVALIVVCLDGSLSNTSPENSLNIIAGSIIHTLLLFFEREQEKQAKKKLLAN